jgi:glycosyltransferase involved in cell wall biosynthesis
MKVCHLSFSSSGGASKVAAEISSFQSQKNIHSNFYFLINSSIKENIIHIPDIFFSAVIDNYIISNNKNDLFSILRNRINKVSINFSRERYDFIHIHWLPGFVNLDFLIEDLSPYTRHIFWHVQDLNPITGGCHYSGSCVENQRNCYPCPKVKPIFRQIVKSNFETRVKKINLIENLSFIFPSHWVKKNYLNSSLPKRDNFVIPNPHKFTTPLVKFIRRDKFGLNAKDLVLGVVVGDILESRKNISKLINYFEKILLKIPEIKLVLIGSNSKIYSNDKILVYDKITDNSLLKELYSIMDFNLIFSSEETFGYTVVEAANQKVPSIVYKNSAVSELIKDGETGYLFENFYEFAKVITNFDRQQNDKVGESAFNYLYKKCNTDNVYTEYQKLYNLY